MRGLRREIAALARLRHPGVVQIIEHGLEQGLPWYAMELLEGPTLRRWVGELLGAGEPGRFEAAPAGTRGVTQAEEKTPVPGTWSGSLSLLGESSSFGLIGASLKEKSDREGVAFPDLRDLGKARSRFEEEPGWWTGSLDGSVTLGSVTGVLGSPDALSTEGATSSLSSAGSSDSPVVGSPIHPPQAGGSREVILLPGEEQIAAILRLMVRLCHTLAFLHGEGVVHRDLKPSNILVMDSVSPVVVDFGLALHVGGHSSREKLQAEFGSVGTIAYMAPEQIRGEACDARTDLYALGCMLYELLTGRHPFRGSSVEWVLHKHLELVPRPPAQLNESIPGELDELILRLLEKEPRSRLGYASDVAVRLLGLLNAELTPPGFEAELEPLSSEKVRAYTYRPGFCGRSELLSQLSALAEERRAVGGGALILVGGESGIGKTRFVAELSRQLAAESAVLVGECLPVSGAEGRGEGGIPLQPLRPALESVADHCRRLGREETDRVLGSRGRVLAPYVPALWGLPGQDDQPSPADLPAEAARLRLLEALASTLAALSELQPLLLVLDDLQWADELTLELLQHLGRGNRLDTSRLVVVGTYRTEELTPALRRLGDAGRVQSVMLERLTPLEVGSVVRDMLALDSSPDRFVAFLARHSEGNPFFVAEYLRAAVDRGLLYRDERGQWQVSVPEQQEAEPPDYESLPLPLSLRALVGRRLDGLEDVARRVLEQGAVLGREFDEGVLIAGLCDESEDEALEAIETLCRRQILENVPPERLRFVHDKIREVTYGQMQSERLQQLHRRAAEVLANRGLSGADLELLAEEGWHWERAGERARARRCYLAGGQSARERTAFEEADRLLTSYLALVESPDGESIAVRLTLAEKILPVRGRLKEAEEQVRRALSEAEVVGERRLEMESLRLLSSTVAGVGELERAEEMVGEALQIARELGDQRAEVVLLAHLAENVLITRGQYAPAHQSFQQALDLAVELGDRGLEAENLDAIGRLHLLQGRLEQAHENFVRAIELARESGAPLAEMGYQSNLSLIHQEQGDYEQARALAEQTLVLARQLGFRTRELHILLNLGVLLEELNQLEEALSLLRQCLSLSRQLGAHYSEALCLLNLAEVQRRRGRIEACRSLLDQGRDAFARLGDERAVAIQSLVRAMLVRQVDGEFSAGGGALPRVGIADASSQ